MASVDVNHHVYLLYDFHCETDLDIDLTKAKSVWNTHSKRLELHVQDFLSRAVTKYKNVQ